MHNDYSIVLLLVIMKFDTFRPATNEDAKWSRILTIYNDLLDIHKKHGDPDVNGSNACNSSESDGEDNDTCLTRKVIDLIGADKTHNNTAFLDSIQDLSCEHV